MKAADRAFLSDLGDCPGRSLVEIGGNHKRRLHAIRILEHQTLLAEAGAGSRHGRPGALEALPPERQAARWDGELRERGLADATAAAPRVLPGKEGEHRAGRTDSSP